MTGHLTYDAHTARVEQLQRRSSEVAQRRVAPATAPRARRRVRLAALATVGRATAADRVARLAT